MARGKFLLIFAFFILTARFSLIVFRVPKDKKGPIDSFWKLRDSEGYVINRDGSRSACVHQWDRWYKELHKFIDSKLF